MYNIEVCVCVRVSCVVCVGGGERETYYINNGDWKEAHMGCLGSVGSVKS